MRALNRAAVGEVVEVGGLKFCLFDWAGRVERSRSRSVLEAGGESRPASAQKSIEAQEFGKLGCCRLPWKSG